MNKGQWKPGTDHRRARLTKDDVIAIRATYRPWSTTLAELAEAYGVAVHTIWKVVHRESYREI